MEPSINNALIVKNIVHPGNKQAVFKDGAKVSFHFQTRLCNKEKTILDDSRKMGSGKPVDLVLGKKFKLEVWEVIVQKMAINEVAQFTVDKSLVLQYPFISKTLRDVHIPQVERKSHCCAMTLQSAGVGYDDLNDLLKNPCDLEFTIELISVEQPEDYQKESWQMDEQEKLDIVPKLREKGNEDFRQKKYKEASEHYARAIGILEQLMLKEKPHDTEWNKLNHLKLPLLLNFAQCKLSEGDFYPVIEHCTTVLTTEPDNVKALFRRAKAHVAVWNPDEARRDFERVTELDKNLTSLVKKELNNLDALIQAKHNKDKEIFKKLFH